MRVLEKSQTMNVPKVEKKHLVAGGVITAIALVAFGLGSKSNSGVAVAKPAHEMGDTQSPNRAPAAAPSESSDESIYHEEEVIEVQVAKSGVETVVVSPSSVKEKKDERGIFTRVFDTYADAWTSVNHKVVTLQQVEDENKKLKMENAYLRVMSESQKFTCRAEEAKKKTDTVGNKLATTAGSRAARSIPSIRYQFPENLLPEHLHALGVSYFKVKDDEKVAVIFSFLTEIEDGQAFRTAANYLMAGISFYRLDHFKNASDYFERISKMNDADEETLKAKRQATYWQALVAERMKNRGLAQKLILENLEKNPQTKEAHWVNPQGLATKSRMPANAAEEESHEGRSPKQK